MAANIARWNGFTWFPLAQGLTCAPGDSVQVNALCVSPDGTRLVAGGHFTQAGGAPAYSIASWDGSSWTPLGSGTDGTVRALTPFGDGVAAAGDFQKAGTGKANFIAFYGGGESWDTSVWSGLGAGLDAPASALAVYNDRLVAGGGFTMAGGAPVRYAATWDGVSWTSLNGGLSPGAGLNGTADAALGDQGRVVVGGEFDNAGGRRVGNIASWTGSGWDSLAGGMSGPVTALASYNGQVIAAGSFRSAGSAHVANIARWTGTDWEPLGEGIDQTEQGRALSIRDMTVYHDELIVGGLFNYAGSRLVSNIARWDGSEWKSLGMGVEGDTWGAVECLQVYDDKLVVGGHLTQAGGNVVSRLAAWDGTSWTALADSSGNGIAAGAGGPRDGEDVAVHDLAVYNGVLVAGGSFGTAGGAEARNLARWDGSAWTPLAAGAGCDSTVLSLTVYSGDLVAAGRFNRVFTQGGTISPGHVARWDGASWSAFGGGAGSGDTGRSGTDGPILCLSISGANLIAGGSFARAGDVPSSNVAFWTEEGTAYFSFPRTVVGDTTSLSIQIDNPDASPVTLRSFELPAGEFLFTAAFEDSLGRGIEIPAQSAVRTRVLFAPSRDGFFEGEAGFQMDPTGYRRRILFAGEGRAIQMTWTSEYLYGKRPLREGEPIAVQMTLADDVPVDSLALWYREGGAADYQRAPMALVDPGLHMYAGEVPSTAAGLRGAQFYVVAYAGSARGFFHTAEDPICVQTRMDTVVFPWEEPPKAYRLISFPVQLGSPWLLSVLGDDLGGQDIRKWRMFAARSDSSSTFRELYMDQDSLAQGRGYWLITRDPVRLDTGPESGFSTPADSAFVLRLNPGWNMIGDPFAFPVAWDSTMDDAVERPYRWDWSAREWRDGVTVLQPFEGYVVKNATGAPLLLRIPPIEAAAETPVEGVPAGSDQSPMASGVQRPGRTHVSRDDWSIRIIASSGACRDGSNLIGVKTAAAEGRDRLDRSEPPVPPGEWLSLYFPHEDWGRNRGRYAADIRPPARAGEAWCESWDFDVAADPESRPEARRVDLEFGGLDGMPADYSAVLVDRVLGRQIDLRAVAGCDFILGGATSAHARFALFIGDQEEVRRRIAGGARIPERTGLDLVWPNPSLGTVAIRFAQAGVGVTRLDIVDVLGRRVRELAGGDRAPGVYELVWDGKDADGRMAASGVYFVRLESRDRQDVRKVLLTR